MKKVKVIFVGFKKLTQVHQMRSFDIHLMGSVLSIFLSCLTNPYCNWSDRSGYKIQ